MKQLVKNTLVILFFGASLISAETSVSQSKTGTITIRKGQSLDFLSGIRKPGTDELLNTYFSKVLGSAAQYGFKVDASFLSVIPPTKGNYHASFISLSSWSQASKRDEFIKDAAKWSYDYVTERRKIWSVFNLTQYDNLKEDIELTVDSDKIYVFTAYWVKDRRSFEAASKRNLQKIKSAGGKQLLMLESGTSPSGYFYNPDVITMTEWKSMEAFTEYKNTIGKTDETGTLNANQWVTRFLQ